jgi:hypothetical protein
MNTYNSIVPSELNNRDLTSICIDIQTSINWGLKTCTVKLTNGLEYKIPVTQLKDYQEQRQILTGKTKI